MNTKNQVTAAMLLSFGILMPLSSAGAAESSLFEASLHPMVLCAAGQPITECPNPSADHEYLRDDYKYGASAYVTDELFGGQVASPKSIEFDLDGNGSFEDGGRPVPQYRCWRLPNPVSWCFDSLPQGPGISTAFFTPKVTEPQRTIGVRRTALDGSVKVKTFTRPIPYRRAFIRWNDPAVTVKAFVWGASKASNGVQDVVNTSAPGENLPPDQPTGGGLQAGDLLTANGFDVNTRIVTESPNPDYQRRIALVSRATGVVTRSSSPSTPNFIDGPPFTHKDNFVLGICQAAGGATKINVVFVQLNGTVETRAVDLAGKGNGAIVGRAPVSYSFQPPAGWCDNVKDVTGGGSTTTSPTPTPVAVTAKVSKSSRTAQSKFSIKTTGIKDGSTLRLLWSRTGAKQFVKRSKVTSNRAVGVAPKVAGKYRLVVKSGSKTLLSKKFVVRAS